MRYSIIKTRGKNIIKDLRVLLKSFYRILDRRELVNFLIKLIQTPSHIDSPGQEKNVAEVIADFLNHNGLETNLIDVIDGRPNVISCLDGKHDFSLLYNGHIDTIPPLDWKDAFSGKIKEGKIYGRGAADMKSGVAAMAYALVMIKRIGLLLPGKITFAGVIDEEFSGSSGTQNLIKNSSQFNFAVVGEPTNLKIAPFHKGQEYIRILFCGSAGHSSVVNEKEHVIYQMCEFINALREYSFNILKRRIHVYTGQSSIHVGFVKGGSQPNVVPLNCEVQFERRLIPGENRQQVYEEIKQIINRLEFKNINVEISPMKQSLECKRNPLNTPINSDIVKKMKKTVKLVLGDESPVVGLPYWTDASILSDAGIETIVFGPGKIEQAHSCNEYIEIDSLIKATIIYAILPYFLVYHAPG